MTRSISELNWFLRRYVGFRDVLVLMIAKSKVAPTPRWYWAVAAAVVMWSLFLLQGQLRQLPLVKRDMWLTAALFSDHGNGTYHSWDSKSVEVPCFYVGLLSLTILVLSGLVVGRSRVPGSAKPAGGALVCSVIPDDYKAAGVLFFTRVSASGEVDCVLLGIEERKVSRKELGIGAGSEKMPVLLFPQGKRESCDGSFIDTALREFVEETADPQGLARFLDVSAECWQRSLATNYFASAKMAVIFCEVSAELGNVDVTTPATVPLRLAWVSAKELRRALTSASPDADVRTSLGHFKLFPLARRFLRGRESATWLGLRLPEDSRAA